MATTYNLKWTVTRGEEDIDICVDYEMTPIIPAQTYGPPENCYPAEGGEITITSVWRKADEDMPKAPEFTLTDEEISVLEQHIWDNPPVSDDYYYDY